MSASLIKLFARVNLSNSSRALSCQAPVVTAAHKPFLSNRIEQEVRIESQGLLCQSFSTNCRKVDLGCFQPQLRSFSTGNVLCMERINRKKELKEHERSFDMGTRGELSLTQAYELPALEQKLAEAASKNEEGLETEKVRRTALDWMPREDDYEFVYENGKKFKELPILIVNAGKNNTKFTMTDARHILKGYTTAGIEGFKGAKRGTNIAAQTAAMSYAKRLVRQSKVTHVRVIVRGVGPGRLSALEGFVMGGLNVVSITDNSKVFGLDQGQGPGPRSRKRRRV